MNPLNLDAAGWLASIAVTLAIVAIFAAAFVGCSVIVG